MKDLWHKQWAESPLSVVEIANKPNTGSNPDSFIQPLGRVRSMTLTKPSIASSLEKGTGEGN